MTINYPIIIMVESTRIKKSFNKLLWRRSISCKFYSKVSDKPNSRADSSSFPRRGRAYKDGVKVRKERLRANTKITLPL
jgi:hypothetical protein